MMTDYRIAPERCQRAMSVRPRTDNVRVSARVLRVLVCAPRSRARIVEQKQLSLFVVRPPHTTWYASCTGRLPDSYYLRGVAMSLTKNPFDPDVKLNCGCGHHASQAEHDAALARDAEALQGRAVEHAVMRALFPHDATRRSFIRAVGGTTALAAVSALFPLAAAKEAFAQGGKIEKPNLKVGFIPITCGTPIIMAQPMGFYGRQGLNVDVVKTAGWAVIRDKTINKEYDAAHMLSPMPLAISLGVGSKPIPYTMPAVENINGQAITLSIKHKDKRDPKQWKGFMFAVTFDYSMYNYLLRYFLTEHGLDPDRDVHFRAVPPPEMVANLRADNIDGFLAPDPVNQRAVYDGVGFI